MSANLDPFDTEILRALHKDGRQTINELAARIGLSPSPTARRLRRLEEAGIISGYAALIDEEALGFGVTVLSQSSWTSRWTRRWPISRRRSAPSPRWWIAG